MPANVVEQCRFSPQEALESKFPMEQSCQGPIGFWIYRAYDRLKLVVLSLHWLLSRNFHMVGLSFSTRDK